MKRWTDNALKFSFMLSKLVGDVNTILTLLVFTASVVDLRFI